MILRHHHPTRAGRTLSGQVTEAFYHSVRHADPISSA
jgi:methionine synthase I (cobalamin-dependent)